MHGESVRIMHETAGVPAPCMAGHILCGRMTQAQATSTGALPLWATDPGVEEGDHALPARASTKLASLFLPPAVADAPRQSWAPAEPIGFRPSFPCTPVAAELPHRIPRPWLESP